MKKLIILTVLIIGVIINANAGDNQKIITGEKIVIKSNILNEERTILIALPANYENTGSRYPVLYVLDGRTHFRQASGAADFLNRFGTGPEMIVVAVTNVDRVRDFTPVHRNNRPTSGGAEKFRDFVVSELLPVIKDNYRVTGYNIIMGHSLGGTFITYLFLNDPDVFDAYISVSPYLQFADNYIVKQAKTKLKKNYDTPKSFFMTIGEEPDYYQALDEFSDLMEKRTKNSVNFLYVQLNGETHGTTPYFSLFDGLRFTFSDWALPGDTFREGLEAVDRHYDKLSKKYNCNITATEKTINIMGYYFLQQGETQKAINIFRENTKRYPGSANVYDSLGEALEKNNQLAEAEKNYQKTVEIARLQSHPNLNIFEQNLKRIQDKLAQK